MGKKGRGGAERACNEDLVKVCQLFIIGASTHNLGLKVTPDSTALS